MPRRARSVRCFPAKPAFLSQAASYSCCWPLVLRPFATASFRSAEGLVTCCRQLAFPTRNKAKKRQQSQGASGDSTTRFGEYTDCNWTAYQLPEVGPSLKEAELSSRFFPGFLRRPCAPRPVTGEAVIFLSSKGSGEPLRRRRRIGPSPRVLRVDATAEARGAGPSVEPERRFGGDRPG